MKNLFTTNLYVKMEKIPRGKRASESQKEYLINFLEENIDIANDKFVTAEGAKFRDKKWKELANNLNALGGTLKDGAKWRKYWSDLKLHTRSKYIATKQAKRRSSTNGITRVKPLSRLEERVIKIAAGAIDGDETPEVGLKDIPALREESIYISQALKLNMEDYEVVDITPADYDGPSCSSTVHNVLSPATISDFTSAQPKEKRKPRPEMPHLEKILRIEEQKLAEMETLNNLKREEIAIQRQQLVETRKQTSAIEADSRIKECLLSRLQSLVDVLKKQN